MKRTICFVLMSTLLMACQFGSMAAAQEPRNDRPVTEALTSADHHSRPAPAAGSKSASGSTGTQGDATIAEKLVFTTVDGSTLKLSELRGRIVVLHFWWSRCNACNSSFRMLRKIRAHHTDEKLAMIGAAVDKDKTIVARVARDRGLNWPQCADEMCWIQPLRDAHHDYASDPKIFTLPRCWIFDSEGRLRFRVHPQFAESMIQLLLKEMK